MDRLELMAPEIALCLSYVYQDQERMKLESLQGSISSQVVQW